MKSGDCTLITNAVVSHVDMDGEANQARGVMGPPRWKNAAFVYGAAGVRQTLRMRY